MPHIRFTTDRPIDNLTLLREAIAQAMQAALGKSPERCMIQLEANQSLAMGDGTPGCAFADIRIKGQADPTAARSLAQAIAGAASIQLNIPASQVYTSLLQIEDPAIFGALF